MPYPSESDKYNNQAERGLGVYFHSFFYFLCGMDVELKDSWPLMGPGMLGQSADSVEAREPNEGKMERHEYSQ